MKVINDWQLQDTLLTNLPILKHLFSIVSFPGLKKFANLWQLSFQALVQVEEVMDSMRLGPNGGLLYAVQFVRTNLAWLDTQLAAVDQGAYLMFDCPGQVELFTADSNMKVRIQYNTYNIHTKLHFL